MRYYFFSSLSFSFHRESRSSLAKSNSIFHPKGKNHKKSFQFMTKNFFSFFFFLEKIVYRAEEARAVERPPAGVEPSTNFFQDSLVSRTTFSA